MALPFKPGRALLAVAVLLIATTSLNAQAVTYGQAAPTNTGPQYSLVQPPTGLAQQISAQLSAVPPAAPQSAMPPAAPQYGAPQYAGPQPTIAGQPIGPESSPACTPQRASRATAHRPGGQSVTLVGRLIRPNAYFTTEQSQDPPIPTTITLTPPPFDVGPGTTEAATNTTANGFTGPPRYLFTGPTLPVSGPEAASFAPAGPVLRGAPQGPTSQPENGEPPAMSPRVAILQTTHGIVFVDQDFGPAAASLPANGELVAVQGHLVDRDGAQYLVANAAAVLPQRVGTLGTGYGAPGTSTPPALANPVMAGVGRLQFGPVIPTNPITGAVLPGGSATAQAGDTSHSGIGH